MKLEDAKPGDVLVDKDGDAVLDGPIKTLFDVAEGCAVYDARNAVWMKVAADRAVRFFGRPCEFHKSAFAAADERFGPYRPAVVRHDDPVPPCAVLDGPIKTLFDVAEGCAVYDARNAVWMKVAADRAVRFFGRPCEFHKSAFAAADERFGPYRPAVVRHDDPVPPCAVLDGPIKTLTPTELAALGRKPLAPADPLGWEVE